MVSYLGNSFCSFQFPNRIETEANVMAYRGIEYVTGVAMFIAAFWVYDHMRYARGVYSDVRDKPTPLKTALRLNMVSLMGVSFCLLLTPWYELYRVRPWVAIMGTVAWAILWRMVVRKGLWRPWMILVWGAMLIAGGVYLGGIPERFEGIYLMTVLNYAPTLYLYAVTDKRTVLYRMSAKQSYAREDVQVAAVLFVGGHIYLYWGLTEATAQFLESALANGQAVTLLTICVVLATYLVHLVRKTWGARSAETQTSGNVCVVPIVGAAPHELRIPSKKRGAPPA